MLVRILFAFLVFAFFQAETNAQSVQSISNNVSTWFTSDANGLMENQSLLQRGRRHSHGDFQRFGVTVNYRIGNMYEPLDNSSEIHSYLEESAVSLNLRLYNIRNWAFRLGAGYRNLDYQIDNTGLAVDYEAFRRDYTVVLGLEKHFLLGDAFDVYPGIVVPIAFIGEDELNNQFANNIENGDLVASFGVLVGANVRLFKILRLGAEFTGTYDEFKQKVVANFPSNTDNIKLQNLHFYTDITLGLTF